jgi:hypothetical protein
VKDKLKKKAIKFLAKTGISYSGVRKKPLANVTGRTNRLDNH